MTWLFCSAAARLWDAESQIRTRGSSAARRNREGDAERVVAVALPGVIHGAQGGAVVAEEEELSAARGEPRQRDAEEAHRGPAPPRALEEVAHHRIELELRARGRDGPRPRQGLEVGIAELERDGARLDAAFARPPRDPLAQGAEHRLDAARIANVLAERALVGDAADGAAGGVVLLEGGPLAPEEMLALAAAAGLDRRGPGAEDAAEHRRRRGGDVGE